MTDRPDRPTEGRGRRPRLDPATARIRTAVREALPAEPARFLVALSGGADSLALAAACGHLSRTGPHRFTALVVDHGLQAGSAAVAARAASQAEGCGIPASVVRVGVAEEPAGIEAAARSARYAALDERRQEVGALAVLTGHTRDDQAETVLLGLARGSGPRSLAGMRPRAGAVWRPLLAVTREETLASCAAQGLEVWHDPMNADPAFARVRARTRVLPVLEEELGPGIAAALARTAAVLADDSDALEEMSARRAPDVVAGERIRAAAAELPAALRTRIVRDWLRSHAGTAQEVGRLHIVAVDDLLCRRRLGAVSVPGGAEAVAEADGGIVLRRAGGRGRAASGGPTGEDGQGRSLR